MKWSANKKNEFWDDVLLRHNGFKLTPEEMKKDSLYVYNHCFGNMVGMVMQTLIENKLIKL